MKRSGVRLSLSVQYAVTGDDLPSRTELRRWVAAASTADADVTLRFVDAAEGESLNLGYRRKRGPTNVLSFVYDDRPGIVHGDVVLCLPVLRREAAAQGKTFAAHCAHLVVHGMLHLQGFDHRRADEAAVMEGARSRDSGFARHRRSVPAALATAREREGARVAMTEASRGDERGAKVADKPTLLERLSAFLTREPEDREELLKLLHGSFERKLLDADALSIIEGALQVSEMTVRDIMIPRAQMDVISIEDEPAGFIPFVLETRHSRFPVIGENKDDVIGILLAKELLNYYANPEGFNLRDTLRPAVFVPESKRLNVLLRDFRSNRNQIAIVVDEYGGVSGLVTIEDVLEQIVGDIEDEYDFDEAEDNIIPEASGRYRVKAQTEIADFNQALGTDFADDEYATVGGLVLKGFKRMPKRSESTTVDNVRFKVIRADSRRIYTVQVEKLTPIPDDEPEPGEA